MISSKKNHCHIFIGCNVAYVTMFYPEMFASFSEGAMFLVF